MVVRIILILGSIGGLVTSVFSLILVYSGGFSIDANTNDKEIGYIFLVFCIIFFTLNTFYILGGRRSRISLYFKRKKLEEEIKIQESENKLKELKNKK